MAKAEKPKAKPKPKFTDKAQSERFIETARKLGIEETGEMELQCQRRDGFKASVYGLRVTVNIADITKSLGSLKRLQALLETIANGADISAILSPFFVLRDLRDAYSHLTSDDHATEILEQVTKRLGIDSAPGLLDIYRCLLKALGASYEKLVTIVRERI